MRLFRKISVGIFVAATVNNASAQNTNDVRTLEPIKVTAMLMEQELKEVPLSVSVIDRATIERSSASTTAELLADIPGIDIYDGAMSGMKRVAIRGEGDRTLVLVDGLRISEQKSMSGTPVLVSPSEIERIEVVKGPGSVLYGSEAIGGVVNIITKKGSAEKTSFSVNADYDTALNGSQITGRASVKSGNSRVYASVSRSDFGNRESAEGEVDDTSWNSTAVGAGLAYDTAKKSAGLNFSYFDAEYEVNTGSPFMKMDLPSWERTRFNAFYEQRDISAYLAKIRADVYYQRTEKDFINDIAWSSMMGMPPFMGTWSEYKKTQNKQDTVGAKLQSDWLLGDQHYFIAGLDVMADFLKSDDFSRTQASGSFLAPPFSKVPGVLNMHPEASRWQSALFFQDEWRFAENWTFVPGYRATFSLTDNQADAATGTTDLDDESLNGTASFALVNTSVDDLTLRAVVSQGYRLPTLGELYTTSGMAGEYITGNPHLEEETSVSGELGARYFTDQLMLDVAMFYTEAEDYIDSVNDASVATGKTYKNMDEATTYGGEFYAKYDLSTSKTTELAPYLNMTLMRREYVNNDGATWDTGYPTAKGRIGLRVETPLTSGVSGWIDSYVRAAGSAKTNGEGEDPGWATLNLMVGFNIENRESAFCDNLRVQFGLLNILNKSYTEARNSIAAPKRSVYLSLGINF